MQEYSILEVIWPVFVYMRLTDDLSRDLPAWVSRESPEDEGGVLGPNILGNSGQVDVTRLVGDLGIAGRFPQRDKVILRPWHKTGSSRLEAPFRKISSRQLRQPEHYMAQLGHLFSNYTWVAKAGWNTDKAYGPERFYVSLTRPTRGMAPQRALRVEEGRFVLVPV